MQYARARRERRATSARRGDGFAPLRGAVVAVAVGGGLGGCRIGFDELSRDGALSDAVGDTASSSDGCDLNQPFSTPVLISELSDPNNDDGTLRLAADELTGYYWKANSGTTDIYFAQRASRSAPFSSTPVAELDTAARQLDPTVSSDGALIVFRRSGPGDHLYEATRSGPTTFGTATLIANVDTGADEQAYLRPDSDEMIFSSARGGSSGDLYRTTHTGAAFIAPALITELSPTTSEEGDPVITADGLTIYFRSDRPAADAGFNIWVARRASVGQAFDPPTEVRELSSSGAEGPSDISRDGCRIYLSSDRAGTNDIYVASRPAK